ncbi:MAG: hypothetical protein PHY18_05200 [Dehalococcoidales bacterium]|nr:hypothetical protein [Dehalococcoidales bacterium]
MNEATLPARIARIDRDRAAAIQSTRLARLQALRSAGERCRAKLAAPSFAGDRHQLGIRLEEINESILRMEERTAGVLQPQPGISMNATIGWIISALRELTARIEALEGGLP